MTLKDAIPRLIQQALVPVNRRVRGLVSRAVVRVVNDALGQQGVQVSLGVGEVRSDVEHHQPYGFSAHPHPDAEGIFLSVGGSRNAGVVLAVGDRRYRLRSLEQGEVAIYDDLGTRVHLRRGGVLTLSAERIELGEGATKRVAREGDAVSASTAMTTWMGQVQLAINGLAPASVTQTVGTLGAVAGGSDLVRGAD